MLGRVQVIVPLAADEVVVPQSVGDVSAPDVEWYARTDCRLSVIVAVYATATLVEFVYVGVIVPSVAAGMKTIESSAETGMSSTLLAASVDRVKT